MKPDQAFSDLIGRIYDCALDGSLWPSVLAEITHALDGVMGDLTVIDPVAGVYQVKAFHNWPEDVLERAAAYFHISPTASLPLTIPLLEPLCSSRYLDIHAFHNSRYWKTCFAGRGYYDYLLTGISRDVSRVASWGVLGSEDRGAFGDEDLELARMLSPHIRRSVEISGVLGHHRIEAGTLRAALDTLAAAALIVEPDGRILFRNAAAGAELEHGSIFREINGRLVGITPEARNPLLGPNGAASQQRGRDAVVTDARGRTVHITWAALEQAGEELGSPILLLLRQPEPELKTPLSVAASTFTLTAAETQVLAQVTQSRPLAEIADHLGVARSTVKTHLDAIYRKTETRRQSELVRLVLSLASPLRP